MTAPPQKVYIETTTRCNLRCRMCLKHESDNDIGDRDMSFSLFTRLKPLIEKAQTINLNGIGEPLMNPRLTDMVAFARACNPRATIAFQTNGYLLDREKMRALLDAGLSELCLSIDSLASDQSGLHGGQDIGKLEKGMSAVLAERDLRFATFRVGVETVLSRNNLEELPNIISWAIENGADYGIVTHILPHNRDSENDSLFNADSAEAEAIFKRWNHKAEQLGIDLQTYYHQMWKRGRSDRKSPAALFLDNMLDEARDKQIWLNVEGLYNKRPFDRQATQKIFGAVTDLAKQDDFELFLPPLQADGSHDCRFIREKSLFITVDGQVSPCNGLWHTVSSYMAGEKITCHARQYGSVLEENPIAIWNKPSYRAFREEVETATFPNCRSCAVSPCADINGNHYPFATDCYGNITPCGSCLWSQGGIRCL